MVRLSSSAHKQSLDLIDHHLAGLTIGEHPFAGRDYPSVSISLTWPNVKWVKIHRYRFAYTANDDPVIFNTLWDTADILGRDNLPC